MAKLHRVVQQLCTKVTQGLFPEHSSTSQNVIQLSCTTCCQTSLHDGPIKNVSLYFCFYLRQLLIDFQIFFHWHALWKAMKGIGVPNVILGLIIDLHTATTARVRLVGRCSSPFSTTSGVRQGCVLAPALFCRAMDFIMDHVSRKVGIQVGLHTFTDIDYADDVTLLVDTQDKYPIALSAMDKEASKFGLHVSWSKTKIQNLGCGPTPSTVVVNGNTVEPVQDFTYLGSIQTSNRNSSSECTRRIGLAAGVMKRLDLILNQPNLTISTKICIYSTCVLAVLLYGSETWTLTQAD